LISGATTVAWLDSIKEIQEQSQKEGFNEQQTKLLLKQYLGDCLKKDQIKYILYDN
jgi:hypothetical protein